MVSRGAVSIPLLQSRFSKSTINSNTCLRRGSYDDDDDDDDGDDDDDNDDGDDDDNSSKNSY